MDEVTDRLQLLLPDPLVPPYVLFVGDGVGWRSDQDRPSAQVLFARDRASLSDVLEFVGVPMVMMKWGDLTVCTRMANPKDRVALNVLADWMLDGVPPFVGAVVVLNGTSLS